MERVGEDLSGEIRAIGDQMVDTVVTHTQMNGAGIMAETGEILSQIQTPTQAQTHPVGTRARVQNGIISVGRIRRNGGVKNMEIPDTMKTNSARNTGVVGATLTLIRTRIQTQTAAETGVANLTV